jgi:hypothetical protein
MLGSMQCLKYHKKVHATKTKYDMIHFILAPNSLVGTLGEGIGGNVEALAATSGRQVQAALEAQGKVGGEGNGHRLVLHV